MYQVSDAYIAAFRSPLRKDRVRGRILLKSGTIITLDNSSIIARSLSITKKTCSSKFDIGTFNCAEMSLGIYDNAAYDHEFGGAVIALIYDVCIDSTNNTWESVPLNYFYVDGKQVTRKRNQVTMRAYDKVSFFDVVLPADIPTTSLYDALTFICSYAKVTLATTRAELEAMPNGTVIPDFTNEKIQSCRDVVMWIAQLVGGCAYIDYTGRLAIKQYYYAGGNVYDRLVTADERTTIEYGDTRTYLAYLSSYCMGEHKNYAKVTEFVGTDAPHIKEGALSIPDNPLVQSLTEAEQDAVNNTLLNMRSLPTRYIKMQGFVDPALEVYDVVAFSGGNIDVGQIINVATEIKWKYRGIGHIVCNNIEEYADEADETATVMTLAEGEDAVNAQSDDTPTEKIAVKPQSEKEMDAKGNGGIADAALSLISAVQDDKTKLTCSRGSLQMLDMGGNTVISAWNGGIMAGNFRAEAYDSLRIENSAKNLSLSITDGYIDIVMNGKVINVATRNGYGGIHIGGIPIHIYKENGTMPDGMPSDTRLEINNHTFYLSGFGIYYNTDEGIKKILME